MANDPRFEVYQQDSIRGPATGDYGWRFRAANGQISAVGGEGFTRREDAHRAVKDFLVAVADTYGTTPILDVDE